ncbi:TorF family putative porin [Dyella sp.]|uniref:TorF family putative porin n=1 Tax=Dyella sp. TaxID=1869338 RepID=UPI002ED59B40
MKQAWSAVAGWMLIAGGHAEQEQSSSLLGIEVTAATQYVSRGFQQSWGRPALQAGFEHSFPAGWFVGTWASTVSPRFIERGRVEWDAYAGYGGTWHAIGDESVDYRLGLYGYRYPGARMTATGTGYDYAELIASTDWHGWSLSYAITVTRDYFGFNSRTLGLPGQSHSRGSGYLSIGRGLQLGNGYRLDLHYGWQRVNHFSDYSWTDASIAVSRRFAGFDITGSYARGWNAAGVFRHYGTGVPDKAGRIHTSNPIAGAWFLTVGRAF